jgi:indole-3-glycerol phosphate synthase
MAEDILSQIVKRKKEEILAAQKVLPESSLRMNAFQKKERRPFASVFEKPEPTSVNIIAEIKRASPSKGVFNLNLDPVITASAYEQGGAVALSVLTDSDFFKGSPQDLKSARQATGLPVLRKDFLISAYQIYESAAMGADAVLLIVRILAEHQLKDFLKLTKELHMDALVEVHSMEDLEIAGRVEARLIGINNRNLKSFETHIDTAISMVSALEPFQIPVAASGIQSPEDIRRNLDAGIHSFLIGESLVKAKDPKAFIRSLIKAARK